MAEGLTIRQVHEPIAADAISIMAAAACLALRLRRTLTGRSGCKLGRGIAGAAAFFVIIVSRLVSPGPVRRLPPMPSADARSGWWRRGRARSAR